MTKRTKYLAYQAVYLPGYDGGLYPGITFLNSFR